MVKVGNAIRIGCNAWSYNLKSYGFLVSFKLRWSHRDLQGNKQSSSNNKSTHQWAITSKNLLSNRSLIKSGKAGLTYSCRANFLMSKVRSGDPNLKRKVC